MKYWHKKAKLLYACSRKHGVKTDIASLELGLDLTIQEQFPAIV